MSKRKGKTSISDAPETFGFALKEEQIGCLQYLYNKKNGRVLGRDGAGWAKLLLFYAIFYTVLASLFIICLQGLFSVLSTQYPRWQLDESIIGSNPGLGFRPIGRETERGALVQYRPKNQTEVKYWVDLIDEYLQPYNNRSSLGPAGRNQVICSFDQPPGQNQVCALDFSKVDVCNSANKYGYDKASPCFFLKLNRIYNWVPEYYDDINDLPEEMPEQLVKYIKSLPENERKQIWVSCEGQFPADQEVLGTINYYPSQGFPGFFYPYRNTPGYLSPLVAVHIERPPMHRIVNVECRAWAKNINYVRSLNDRQGSVMFEVLID